MEYLPLTPETIEKLKEYLPPVLDPDLQPIIHPNIPDYLTILCEGIRTFEGWYQGSRSWNNRNPGNCRYSSVGYLPKYGVVKRDAQNFAIFETYELGWLYLKNLIIHKATKHPDWSLVSLMKNYAPVEDNNEPVGYATFLGKKLGVNPFLFQLKSLLV